MNLKETASLTATILTAIAACSAAPADAGVVTSDTRAWVNEGVTVGVGETFRQYQIPAVRQEQRTREVVVPAVAAYDIPAYDRDGIHYPAVHVPAVAATTRHETFNVAVPFKKTINGYATYGSLATKLAPNLLVTLTQDRSLSGQVSYRSGSVTVSGGSDVRGNLSVTLAISPTKDLALFVDQRFGQTSYGTQFQLGNSNVHYAYAPASNGHSIGIGFEIGQEPAAKPVTRFVSPIEKEEEIEEKPVKGRG